MYRCWGGLGLKLRDRLQLGDLGLFRKRVNPEYSLERLMLKL